jgi:hypothetical protein
LAEHEDPITAARGAMLLALIEHLESLGPQAIVDCYWMQPELVIVGGGLPAVDVSVDWNDYGPVIDGLPVMHYRVAVSKAGSALSDEARAATAAWWICTHLKAR